MLTAKGQYKRHFDALASEFCFGCSFFLIRVPRIKLIEDALHEPKKFLNRRQVRLVKCAKGYGTECVLVDVNLSDRRHA